MTVNRREEQQRLTIDNQSDVGGVGAEAGHGGDTADGPTVVGGGDDEPVCVEDGLVDHQPQTALSAQRRRRPLSEQRRHVTVADEHGQRRRRVAAYAGAPQSAQRLLSESHLTHDTF